MFVVNPIEPRERQDAECCIIEGETAGYITDNGLNIYESVQKNDDLFVITIENPWPWKLTIPIGTPLATAMPCYRNGLNQIECNELVEITDYKSEQNLFDEHQQMRKRRFQPHLTKPAIEYGPMNAKTKEALEEIVNANNDIYFNHIGFIM